MIQEIYPRLKVFESRSKSKVKATRSKVKVPNERSTHEVSTCEISKPYLYGSRDIPQVKVFEK